MSAFMHGFVYIYFPESSSHLLLSFSDIQDKCQGDCDEDDDCEVCLPLCMDLCMYIFPEAHLIYSCSVSDIQDSLICFQRSDSGKVPGCSGTDDSGRDFCIGSNLRFVGEGLGAGGYGFCEGDCDDDEDCEVGLVADSQLLYIDSHSHSVRPSCPFCSFLFILR